MIALSGSADPTQDNQKVLDDWSLDTCCLYDHNYNSDFVKRKFNTISSYTVFGNVKCSPVIMTYGGSTTSSILGAKWPEYLHEELNSLNIPNCVLNGGCGGYNSWNEMNKMARDVPMFRPNVVISFSGINDFIHHIASNNPFVNLRALKELQSLKAFSGVVLPLTKLDHAELFIKRTKQMKALCDLEGIKFIRIIQPALASSTTYNYDLDDKVDASLYEYNNSNSKFVTYFRKFYKEIELLHESNKLDYLHNEICLFDNESRKFADYRHPNNEGYKDIAKRIVSLMSHHGII